MDYFPLDLAPPKAESLGKIVSAGGVRVSALVRSMIPQSFRLILRSLPVLFA